MKIKRESNQEILKIFQKKVGGDIIQKGEFS